MKDYDEKYIKDEILKDRQNNKDEVFSKNLEIELNDRGFAKDYGYDFVPRLEHWKSIDEQKIEVNNIEDITENK